MDNTTNVVGPQPGTSVGTGHYPDLRGSAASVLAVPPADVPMSATAAAVCPEARTAEDAAGKRQKKEETNLDSLDLEVLPDGFRAGITVADGALELTQGVRSISALVSKHHQAAVLYRRTPKEQAAGQAKLDARLRAM